LLPVHAFLFRGMTAAIAKRAEKKEGEPLDVSA
jgi:hypothetical protein